MKKRSRVLPVPGRRHGRDAGRVAGRGGAADRDHRRGRAGPGAVGGAGAVAAAAGGARPGEGAAGSRARAGGRRGLPGRCRACCAPSPACSGWSPRIRRCPARSTASPTTRPRCWRRSTPPAPRPGRAAWRLAGDHAPDHGTDAGPTAGHRRGRHPGHRALGEGRRGADVQARVRPPPVVGVRRPRPRRAPGSRWRRCCDPGTPARNTAADHLTVIRAALRQLPGYRAGHRPGRKVLIRVDGAGATHEFLDWLHGAAAVLLGRVRPDPSTVADQLAALPAERLAAGLRRRRRARDPAPGSSKSPACSTCPRWPTGMRVIVRKERPHPGAQLRLTDPDGHRLTAFATNTAPAARPPARRPRTAPPPPRPRRGPHPRREGHRAAQPAPARAGPEPDLVRHRRAGLRAHRLDPDARPRRAPRPPVGTQTAAATAVLPRRPTSPAPAAAPLLHLPAHAPWAGARCIDGVTTPAARSPPPADTSPAVPTTPAPRPARGTGAHRATSAELSHPMRQNHTLSTGQTGRRSPPAPATKDPG